jgi:hypothetical protein
MNADCSYPQLRKTDRMRAEVILGWQDELLPRQCSAA